MKRITPQVKAIADAHIRAKAIQIWDNPTCTNAEDVFKFLEDGKTIKEVMLEIEIRYVSITSCLMSNMMDYQTDAYKKAVYKGFKALFTNKK